MTSMHYQVLITSHISRTPNVSMFLSSHESLLEAIEFARSKLQSKISLVSNAELYNMFSKNDDCVAGLPEYGLLLDEDTGVAFTALRIFPKTDKPLCVNALPKRIFRITTLKDKKTEDTFVLRYDREMSKLMTEF